MKQRNPVLYAVVEVDTRTVLEVRQSIKQASAIQKKLEETEGFQLIIIPITYKQLSTFIPF